MPVHVSLIFFYNLAFTFDECDVPAVHRENCGWLGVTAEACVAKGCCFDSSILNTIWCFQKAERKSILK